MEAEATGKRAAVGPSPGRPVSGALVAESISVHFEGVKAVDDVDLELAPPQILGLIGPNGAGKTTLVNVLSGFQRCDQGTVAVDGEDVTGFAPERRAHAGVVRTFQGSRSFGDLTVAENAEVSGVGTGCAAARPRRGPGSRSSRSGSPLGESRARLSTGEERRLRSRARSRCGRATCFSTSRPPGLTSRRPTSWSSDRRAAASASAAGCC